MTMAEERIESPSEEVTRLNDEVLVAIARLREIKRVYPALRVALNYASRGSILNGYREGDISFDKAVDAFTTAPSC
jgi:hypothetical protein